MKKVFGLCFLILFFFVSHAQHKGNNIDKLMQEWNKADGEQVNMVSFMLAKNFILYDSLFLFKMRDNQNLFENWIGKIQYNIFTIYDYSDSVDIMLTSAYLTKLKCLLIEKALKYRNDKSYSPLVEKILNEVENIKIRIID